MEGDDGGDDGFDAFCHVAYPPLVRALEHVVGDHAVAEELAQEALVRAHQRWGRVGGLRSPLGWTVHVGTNLARSHLRRRTLARRVLPRLAHERAVRHTDPDGADTVAVRAALAELSLPQREAVVLRFVVGLTAVEAAEVLGVAPEAVRARTHRALTALRRDLDVVDPDEDASHRSVTDGRRAGDVPPDPRPPTPRRRPATTRSATVPADLRELLERTSTPPTTTPDPRRIRARSRRRTLRTRLGASAGVTAVVVVAVAASMVAWPGQRSVGPIADRPPAEEAAVPQLDLPAGWVQVEVGGAAFGLPPELPVVELDETDSPPCSNAGGFAYLAPESYPATSNLRDPRSPGSPEPVRPDGPRPEVQCLSVGTSEPHLIAAPLSIVPDWELEALVDGELRATIGPDQVAVGDLDAERTTQLDRQPPVVAEDRFAPAARTEAYELPRVDLYLRFTTNEADTTLTDSILATITPLDGAAERGGDVAPPRPEMATTDPDDHLGPPDGIEGGRPPDHGHDPPVAAPEEPDIATPSDPAPEGNAPPETDPPSGSEEPGTPADLLGRTFRSTPPR